MVESSRYMLQKTPYIKDAINNSRVDNNAEDATRFARGIRLVDEDSKLASVKPSLESHDERREEVGCNCATLDS